MSMTQTGQYAAPYENLTPKMFDEVASNMWKSVASPSPVYPHQSRCCIGVCLVWHPP